MRLRLWRRIRIVPGLRLNLSRGGVSLSVGRRGLWFTTGPRGRRVTVGLPGSGLFLTQQIPPEVLIGLAVLVAIAGRG